jgi:hypothetical protein
MRRTSWLLVARAWVPAKGTADTVAFPAQAASALDAIRGGIDAGQASAAWILERQWHAWPKRTLTLSVFPYSKSWETAVTS